MPSSIPVFVNPLAQLRQDIEFHLISIASPLLLCITFAICRPLYRLKRHARHEISPAVDQAMKNDDVDIARLLPSSLTRPPPSVRPGDIAWDVDILPIQTLLSSLLILAEQEEYIGIDPFMRELESNPWNRCSSQGEHPPDNVPSQQAGPFEDERSADNEVHATVDELEILTTNAHHTSRETASLSRPSYDDQPSPSISLDSAIFDGSDTSGLDRGRGSSEGPSRSFQDDHYREDPSPGGAVLPEEEIPAASIIAHTEVRRKLKGKEREIPLEVISSHWPPSDDQSLPSTSRAVPALDASDANRLGHDGDGRDGESSQASISPAPLDRIRDSRHSVDQDYQDIVERLSNAAPTSVDVFYSPESPERCVVNPAVPGQENVVAGPSFPRLDSAGTVPVDGGESKWLDTLEEGSDTSSLEVLLRTPPSSVASLSSAGLSAQGDATYDTSVTSLYPDGEKAAYEPDNVDTTHPNPELPERVLAYILHLGPSKAGWASLVNASHVCHSWRDTALNYPALWCNIPVRSSAASISFLERSEDMPLYVTLRAIPREPPAIPMHQYFACLSPHMERLHSLSLDLGAAAMSEFLDVCRAWWTPPPLKRLSLHLHQPYSLSIPVDVIQQFNTLRSLSLHNFAFAIISEPMAALAKLKVSMDQTAAYRPVSTNAFVFSLSNMQHLQHLDLDGIDFHAPAGAVRTCLRELALVSLSGSARNALLSQLSLSGRARRIRVCCAAGARDTMHSLGMDGAFWKGLCIDRLRFVAGRDELRVQAWDQDKQTADMAVSRADARDAGFAGRIARDVRPKPVAVRRLEMRGMDLGSMRPFLAQHVPRLENLRHLVLDGCSSIAVLVDVLRERREREAILPALVDVQVLNLPAALKKAEWEAANWLRETWPAA